jgi:hypothetical protein
MEISIILTSILAGITYSLTSFAKTKDEMFDFLKFGTTLAIGVGSGIIAGIFGMDVEAAYEYAIMLGIIPIVENIGKAIYRKIIK